MTSVVLPRKVEVLVTSAGGVGTTFLMKEIGKYLNTNSVDNRDGFKHIPVPPISFGNPKAVYLFGDPVMASVSLFRRQYHTEQSRRVQQYSRNHFIIDPEATIESYAQEGIDKHHFKAHLRAWMETRTSYPILFMRYERLFENLGY